METELAFISGVAMGVGVMWILDRLNQKEDENKVHFEEGFSLWSWMEHDKDHVKIIIPEHEPILVKAAKENQNQA